MNVHEISEIATRTFNGNVRLAVFDAENMLHIELGSTALVAFTRWLVQRVGYRLGGLTAVEGIFDWEVRYAFYDEHSPGWVEAIVRSPRGHRQFPSITSVSHAADWQEREIEDHFGLVFEGHPRLGDFVFHDDEWEEGLEPMRSHFDAARRGEGKTARDDWRPKAILSAPGAFTMTVGPVYAGISEPVHFLLETTGEDVTRVIPRLFYKYRAIEKRSERGTQDHAMLLAERFAATQSFAHATAFCRAIERIGGQGVPPRAAALRLIIAELERIRYHTATIEAVCASTGLAVAAAQAAVIEEDLLRLSGTVFGSRYLSGLARPGGLTRDFDPAQCVLLGEGVARAAARLEELERMLRYTSSFLDRLEEVGVVSQDEARENGLVGPVARASGVPCDLRQCQPYGAYRTVVTQMAVETEGDGYARLRVLFNEVRESARLVALALANLPEGAVCVPVAASEGQGYGWVEAPAGAAYHWVSLDSSGFVERHRIVPASLANWHGFHLAAESFAFQDFPIILATFGLSVAECDR